MLTRGPIELIVPIPSASSAVPSIGHVDGTTGPLARRATVHLTACSGLGGSICRVRCAVQSPASSEESGGSARRRWKMSISEASGILLSACARV